MLRSTVTLTCLLMVSACANVGALQVEIEDLFSSPEKYDGKDVRFVALMLKGRHGLSFDPLVAVQKTKSVCLAPLSDAALSEKQVNFDELRWGRYPVRVTGRFMLGQPQPEIVITSGCQGEYRIRPHTITEISNSNR